MSEKTEKASPYKLQKAKEKGQVSQSKELITCLLLLVLSGVFMALWPMLIQQIKAFMIHLFYLAADFSFTVNNVSHLYQLSWSLLMSLWSPFALISLVCIVLATIAQTGFVWSITPVCPDFNRLNLVLGCKRLFSTKLLFETAKNSLKLLLAFLLLTLSFRHELKQLVNLAIIAPREQTPLIIHCLLKIILQLTLMLFALAIVDKLYTRWKYGKEQRMTRQEVKDEFRQREGDPKIKRKIKELQLQLRQKTGSLAQVKTADVVVTNPTHLAVALKYDHQSMPAPKVVCKAQGETAKQIKRLAQRYQIPIIENKAFARTLFATIELNQWIHSEHFPVAAMIFREIYRQKGVSL